MADQTTSSAPIIAFGTVATCAAGYILYKHLRPAPPATVTHPADMPPAPTRAEMHLIDVPEHPVDNPRFENWRPAPIANCPGDAEIEAICPILATGGHSRVANLLLEANSVVPALPAGCTQLPSPAPSPAPAAATASAPATGAGSSTGETFVVAPVLDLASCDPYELTTNEGAIAAADAALDRYGHGSCGPRGFYGSSGEHIQAERELAAWYGSEAAALYSSGVACTASVIAAFIRRGDVAVVEEGCSGPIQTGLAIAKCDVRTYKPMDLKSLEDELKAVKEKYQAELAEFEALPLHKRLLRRAPAPCGRFIVLDSVSARGNGLQPLRAIADLAERYFFRIILDETSTLGIVGPDRKGLAAESGLSIGLTLPLVTANLGRAFGSLGGICFCDGQLAQYQEVASIAYCFSAAAPPYCAAGARFAVKYISDDARASEVAVMRRHASEIAQLACSAGFRAVSDTINTVTITLPRDEVGAAAEWSRAQELRPDAPDSAFACLLRARLLRHGVLAACAQPPHQALDLAPPAATLRLTVGRCHTDSDVAAVGAALRAFKAELEQVQVQLPRAAKVETLPSSYEQLGNPVPNKE